MAFAHFVPDLLAASRINPVWVNLGLPLAVGMLAGGLGMLLFYLGSKKNRVTMDGAFWQKVMIYGVCGLVAGYFLMRTTIKKNPALFGNKLPLNSKQLKAITENPLPKLPQPKLTNPLAPGFHERPTKVTRNTEHEEREARLNQQQADQQAARLKEQALKEEDVEYLSSLSLGELEKVRDERKTEIDVCKELMRDPNATTDERRAASKRFTTAVKAYQAAFTAVMEKRRQEH